MNSKPSAARPTTIVTLQPRRVIYRTPSGYGTRLVEIEFSGLDPQITGWTENFTKTPERGATVTPLRMYLSEINELVNDARKRLDLPGHAS